MSENYIIINGKKAELTEEQLKALGIEIKYDNPFAEKEQYIYTVIEPGGVDKVLNNPSLIENGLAFNDREFAHQVALHQLLYRKLLKYGYDNNIIDQSEWDGRNYHYFVVQDSKGFYRVRERLTERLLNTVYFNSEDAIYKVIENVILPFQKEYPEFNW